MGLLRVLGLNKPKRLATAATATAGDDALPRDASADPPAGDQVRDAAGPGGAGAVATSAAYDAALAKARAEVATLTEMSVTVDKSKIQTELLDAAQAKAAKGDEAAALALLAKVSERVAAAQQLAVAFNTFATAHAKAQAALDVLRGHAAANRITVRIQAAAIRLAQAQDEAAKRKFDIAMRNVADAQKLCDEALPIADAWAQYLKKRADANAVIGALTGMVGAATIANEKNNVKQAEALVGKSPPDFPGANALLDGVRTRLANAVKASYVTPGRTKATTLRAHAAQAFADADLKQIEALQTQIEADFAADAWSKAVLGGRRLGRLTSPISKMLDRRAGYDRQRAVTVGKLTPLRAAPALAPIVADLDLAFNEGETLASRAAMQFEDGTAKLVEVARRCDLYAAGLAESAQYDSARTAAQKRLDTLEKHAAHERIASQLAAVRRQFADAAAIAGLAMRGGVPAQGFATARTTIARAATDLEAAAKLADSLGPAMALRADASKAGGTEAFKKSIAALRQQAATLRTAAGTAPVQPEFALFEAAIGTADAGAADKAKVAEVKAALVNAADALVAVQTVTGDSSRVAAARAATQARLEALRQLPEAAQIGARIDAVAKGIANADAHVNKRAYADAMGALRQADDAAVQADEAVAGRKAFNTAEAALAARVVKLGDKKLKTELDKQIATARTQADGFTFDAAGKTLDAVEVALQSHAAKALAASDPSGAALRDCAKQMMAKGGAKEVDALIKALPPGTDKKALMALGEERFGFKFTDRPDTEARSIQRMCEVFAKVPDDVAKNPSLRRVEHTDPNTDGGGYATGDSSIEMNGRPGQATQKFGSGIAKELPVADIDPACLPKNEDPVDYLDFATLHEVGHAVDDANTFMAQREGVAEFGGWKRHGASVEPIADAVATAIAATKGVPATAELKKFALDRILRAPTSPPSPPAGADGAKWTQACDDIDAWHKIATAGKPWWSQSACDKITIGGRIYHEAYAQDWVSYLASARKKGLTGYQFRAPGEWFAELYAAYHSGKLKPNHPSASWLAKLST